MSEFEPIRSFGIDNGELDGLTPQEIFVLGYELATVDAKIDAGEPFEMPLVHADNVNRISAYLIEKSFVGRWVFSHEDPSESWVLLRAWPMEGV